MVDYFVGIHFLLKNSPTDSIQESIINHAKDKVTPITSAHIPNLPRRKSHAVEIFQRFQPILKLGKNWWTQNQAFNDLKISQNMWW